MLTTTSSARSELWAALLSDKRLYGQTFPADESHRSEFQRDYDRIIFSPAFRRLQDKTQVFPLSNTDYTRTRLTHSLEASSVGRSLGVLAGKHLLSQGLQCEPYEIGTIVATATLAHDLGNPPFGHSGEAAIQSWARKRLPRIEDGRTTEVFLRNRRKNAGSIKMSSQELADFHCFEGNAQGLRMILRTMARTRKGGLRPTTATIGAMSKYPRPSLLPMDIRGSGPDVSRKKPGYFYDDRLMACKAFRTLNMVETAQGVFSRHPLAFLTEAADDISYLIADLDDGFRVGAVEFDDVRGVLEPIAENDPGFNDTKHLPEPVRLSRVRASALAVLVSACAKAFRESLDEIEAGVLKVPLLDRTSFSSKYADIKALAKEKVYSHERVLQIEYAGYQTIGGLLDMFYAALCESNETGKDEKLLRMLPLDFFWRPGVRKLHTPTGVEQRTRSLESMTQYERLLLVTDYVSGMTDGFAVSLYQRLSGIRLPD